MSKTKSANQPMRTPAQPEQVLTLLNGLCQANWLALLSILALFVVAYQWGPFDWQHAPQTIHLYLGACLLYALANLALHCALRFRGWYEKTPRLAINRLSLLMHVVIGWNLLHMLAAYHFYGSLASPFNALIPLLVVTLFYTLERQQAWLYSVILLIGVVVSQHMQQIDIPYIAETAGRDFLDHRSMLLSQAIILASCILAALRLMQARRYAPSVLHHDERLAPLSRAPLVTQELLQKRGSEELLRAQRHNTPTSYVLVHVGGLDSLLAQDGLDGVMQALQLSATQICRCTRLDLDTVTYLGQAYFGVLLPTANDVAASSVVQRIRALHASASTAQPMLELEFTCSTILPAEQTSFEQCQRTAMQTAQRATAT